MAKYNAKDYLKRLGVTPIDGVYEFTFDEGSEVHDTLVGDLLKGDPIPKDGDKVKIKTSGSKITGIEVVPKGGKRRRTRRSKKRRITRRR